jgi:hypothetical protein
MLGFLTSIPTGRGFHYVKKAETDQYQKAGARI